MENRILLDLLRYLKRVNTGRRLIELHLTHFFTTVQLDDGSVGACMSYYNLRDDVLDRLEQRLQSDCVDPYVMQDVDTLERTVARLVSDEQQRKCLIASVMATVVSALSAPTIRSKGDEWFEVAPHRPPNWAHDAETALVVGFGGLLESLIAEEKIKNVHVVDLSHDRRKGEFDAMIAAWTAQHPTKCITVSGHLEGGRLLNSFDLISITGSTLCNGTLEYFLANRGRDAIVILQGQSASVHPKILFEAGVKWVATTVKPAMLGRMARGGHDGEEMRPLLEGGLPWIYLLPRPGSQRTCPPRFLESLP